MALEFKLFFFGWGLRIILLYIVGDLRKGQASQY